MEAEKSRMRTREKEKETQNVGKKAKTNSQQDNGNCICPNCGAENEPTATFCEQCGTRLHALLCPYCNAPMEENIDFCERCKHYTDKEHCPHCHAKVKEGDAICSNCGESLTGIECPVCHTKGQFSFCEICGTPLTEQAHKLIEEVSRKQTYKEKIQQLTEELEQLWMVQPVTKQSQLQKLEAVAQLRERVFALLNQADEEVYSEKIEDSAPIMNAEDLKQTILTKQEALQTLLDSMAMPPQPNSAQARNYAMACKPTVSRLAWRCNYKKALHKSPLGCACPQCGGKWVLLGNNAHLVNDKK